MIQKSSFSKISHLSLPTAIFLSVLMLCFALLLSSVSLHAQVQNGITGTVTDSTGAVLPHANVSATNNETNVTNKATTSSAGTFTMVGLIPGEYSVTVEAAGFKTVETHITVEVARMSTISVPMSPGARTETVQVKAADITLNTTSPTVGTTLEPELVKNAPIEISGLARQIDSFMYLAPGVQGTATNHNINGGVTFENEVQFNGVPVAFVQYQGNQTYINPPYEAESEFRVDSSTFEPQFGLGQGAVTFNMASGTNELHGDGFEILRNQLFDSAGFFPVRFGPKGTPEPPINQQNDYGFTVGGPIILPKLYNGKNRTFFHVSSDWFRQNQAQSAIGTVPTQAMKSGDFSSFVNAAGTLIPIYDPQTGQPFPGNIIPQSRFSPLAVSLLPDIPNPDRPGLVSGLQSNKAPAIASIKIRQTLWAYTIDHNLTSSQNIHFTQWRDSFSSPTFGNGAPPIVPTSNPLQSQINNTDLGSGFLLNYAKTINTNLVVTAGGDWVGYNIGEHNANNNASFGGAAGSTTFPYVSFDGQNAPTSWGVTTPGSYLQCCSGGLTVINNRTLGLVFVNNWLWTRGRHTFNFGSQFRRTYQDIIDCVQCGGTFNFSQRTTSTPNSSDPNFGLYGSSFASFLLGQVDASERILNSETKLRNKAFAFYAQDNFKLTNRWTFNYGLRWDILVPFTNPMNDIIFVDRTAPNPGAGGLPGAATKFGNCTGCSGITRAAIHFKYFQPRLGFSYQLSPKTVIQAGFYITSLNGGAYEYGTAESASFMTDLLNGSFLRSSTFSNVPGYGSWDSQTLPLPTLTPFSPSIGNAGIIFDFNANKRNIHPNLPSSGSVGTAPYDTAWSLRVQRELPWNMFMTAAYVGNRAIHLPTTLQLSNQPNPSVLQYGSLLGENILAPDVVAAGFTPPYPEFVQQFGSSAILEQALAPYPQFGGYFPTYEMDGTAFYNAFQAQAEKRFVGGVSYLANLTLGRIDANTATGSSPQQPNGVNAYNPKPEYVPSFLDQLYAFKLVGTYELPIGRGKKYLNSNRLVDELAGGWQISAILNYQGGYVMGAYNGYNPLLTNFGDRPNIDTSVPLKTYSYGQSKSYFTGKTAVQPVQFPTNAFPNTATIWEVGDAKRAYASLRAPPLRIENFDAIKSFRIGDRVRAVIRVDYFNAFNRTQFQAPDTNSTDSTFGQITNLTSQITNRQGQATFRVEF
ncbi:MAG TPA: TonB-dependent receptor [Acidobacteriaceae bacterium]|nr:TonB-dependent receptor [Acidobacteriaceae bacterium]